MADEPKKDDSKPAGKPDAKSDKPAEKKEGASSGGSDMWDDFLFWGIIILILWMIISTLISWFSGNWLISQSAFGRYFAARGYDISWVDIFADKNDARLGSGGGTGDDANIIERGGRRLIGVDTNGDGIIDEYIDAPGESNQGAGFIARFWADPSYATFKRLIAENKGLSSFIFVSQILLLLLAGIFGWLTYWLRKKIGVIESEEDATYNTPVTYTPQEDPTLSRWKKIVERINSDSSESWRMAILEADIMLEEVLDANNYPGDTIGEKMQRVERSDFLTIDEAWEAHKIRNAIAHQGDGFALSQREARRVIGLYERVFREFEYLT
jgi:uncharacterized protein YggT (Ycf19 family)